MIRNDIQLKKFRQYLCSLRAIVFSVDESCEDGVRDSHLSEEDAEKIDKASKLIAEVIGSLQAKEQKATKRRPRRGFQMGKLGGP